MKNKRLIIIVMVIMVILTGSFFWYVGAYYRADEVALQALVSDQTVTVETTSYGYHFDGPSQERCLIFYPGAKVEAAAYAPMLHQLASKGMDVCLVKMPFRLAIFNMNKASSIIRHSHYRSWYVGGHSLGGAMAAYYASFHSESLSGLILFAAYPSIKIKNNLNVISIYGSNDGILNMKRVTSGRKLVSGRYHEYVIKGGNHAQFGNYGIQSGDKTAVINAKLQQQLAISYILMHLH
ncbi:MAG: hypothetical protein J6P61_06600 [Erysipelotrichaceae bacterium]|nr:hypothetical protein [Erysipelotrichaceae bacterium]